MMSSYSGCLILSGHENSTRNSALMPDNQLDVSQKRLDWPTEPIRWRPSSSSNSHSDTDYDMSDDTEGSPEPQSSLDLCVTVDQIQDFFNHGYEYITPEEDIAKDEEALASAFKTLDSAMPVFTETNSFVSQSTTASPSLYSDFNAPFTPTEPYFSKFVALPRSVVNQLPLGSTNVARYTTIDPYMLIGIPPDPSNFLMDRVMAAREKAMARDVKGVTFLLPDSSPSCDAQEDGAHGSKYAELASSGAHPIVQPPQDLPSGTDEGTSGPVSPTMIWL
ncbi:hypothetical protein D9619_012865 [Psilocybe cf. subviscida]|uniref:Uncharacterized protein n=1 Tax=Psilocybe cf. subviscida TaxID=2480587 RepID=A0A8H5F4S6_9AGAR|nr:hypothetical protein D9619_012865 [Psilocybe cf. subviscida]